MLTAKALSTDKVLGPDRRRRRLHHQAVRPDRAARAREGNAATREGDAQPLAAHRAAGQHPDPGGDRAAWCRDDTPVRGPVLRPGQLQGVQRPEGVRAGRPPDPGRRRASSRTRSGSTRGRRASSATSAATTSWRCALPRSPRTSPSGSASGSTSIERSSTSPRTSSAASSRWRTARACCRRSPSSAISVGIATTAKRAFEHFGERRRGRDRDETVRQARRRFLLRGRPPHTRVSHASSRTSARTVTGIRCGALLE